MSEKDIPPGRWTPINWGWKYWNYVIIVIGVVAIARGVYKVGLPLVGLAVLIIAYYGL